MSIADRKKEVNGVICALCASFCGCGRRGCGTESGGKMQRVVKGEVMIDERWCREQRRWAALEEEEMQDDDDLYGYND